MTDQELVEGMSKDFPLNKFEVQTLVDPDTFEQRRYLIIDSGKKIFISWSKEREQDYQALKGTTNLDNTLYLRLADEVFKIIMKFKVHVE